MKRSTKIALSLIGSLVALLVVLSVLAQTYFAPLAKSLIETKGSQALGSPLTVESISISLFPPLTVHARNIHFHMKNPDVEATLPEVSFHSALVLTSDVNQILKSLSVELENPQLVLTQTANAAQATTSTAAGSQKAASAKAAPALGPLPDWPLHFKIKRGLVTIHQPGATLQVQPLDFEFDAKSLRSALEFKADSKMSYVSNANASSIEIQSTAKATFHLSENPLRVKGQISLEIPQIIYKSHPSTTTQNTVEPKNTGLPAASKPIQHSTGALSAAEPKSAPLLPDEAVVRTAQIEMQVNIKNINFNNLQIQNVEWVGSLKNGELKGHASIGHVLGGSLKINDLAMNLTQPGNPAQLSLDLEKLNINEALTWKSPSWKDLVKGTLSATAHVSTQGPQAQGSAHLSEAYVSTLQIDQLINEKLAQIPGLKGKELVKSKGFAADIRSDYEYKNSTLNLKNLVFSTPDKNELKAQGTINTNKEANLTGTAFLATAPVGGSIRKANSDADGRFVIPFEIKGNLAHPQISFAQKTVQQMLKNTASQELKNLGTKNLNKTLEQLKKNGLKGLFGH
jgi:hypothetical protein